jgi:hypothetical protein
MLEQIETIALANFTCPIRPKLPGYIAFGPRFLLPPGRYVTCWWFHVPARSSASRMVADCVVWSGDMAKDLAATTFSIPSGDSRLVAISLLCELGQPGDVEFRIWSDGHQGVAVQSISTFRILHRQAGAADFDAEVTARQISKNELWFTAAPSVAQVSGTVLAGNDIVHFDFLSQDTGRLSVQNGEPVFGLSLPSGLFRSPVTGRRIVLSSGNERIELLDRGPGHYGTTPASDSEATSPHLRQAPTIISAPAGDRTLRLFGGPGSPSDACDLGRPVAVLTRIVRYDQAELPKPQAARVIAAGESVDLGPMEHGALHFETGPEADTLELRWGDKTRILDLRRPETGQAIVLVPHDFSGPDARDILPKPSEIHVIAVGKRNANGHGSEVIIDEIWANFLVQKLPLDGVILLGHGYELAGHTIKMWDAMASFGFSERTVIRLVRHSWSGHCILRLWNWAIELDLYSPNQEYVLVAPAIEPRLIGRGLQAEGGEKTHPLLSNYFELRRAAWLRKGSRSPVAVLENAAVEMNPSGSLLLLNSEA